MTRMFYKSFLFLYSCSLIFAVAGCRQAPSATLANPKGSVPRLEKIGNDICRDNLSGLMWQTGRSRKINDGQRAEQYAANLKTGGFNDWRLPTQGEFYTLHILFFLKKNGVCRMKHKGSYWSENPGLPPRPGRWASPYYTCGLNFDFEETKSGFVRAVRP